MPDRKITLNGRLISTLLTIRHHSQSSLRRIVRSFYGFCTDFRLSVRFRRCRSLSRTKRGHLQRSGRFLNIFAENHDSARVFSILKRRVTRNDPLISTTAFSNERDFVLVSKRVSQTLLSVDAPKWTGRAPSWLGCCPPLSFSLFFCVNVG